MPEHGNGAPLESPERRILPSADETDGLIGPSLRGPSPQQSTDSAWWSALEDDQKLSKQLEADLAQALLLRDSALRTAQEAQSALADLRDHHEKASKERSIHDGAQAKLHESLKAAAAAASADLIRYKVRYLHACSCLPGPVGLLKVPSEWSS